MKNWIGGLLAALLLFAVPAFANDISNGSYSTTDNNNNAAPPNGWPAGMFPNQVEPSARANMGATARFWERANPKLSTTGSAGAYVITPSNTSYPTAYTQGEIYCAKANFTSVGADTLNVNGLGALPLYVGTTAFIAGTLPSGRQFCAAYDVSLNSGGGGFQVLAGVANSSVSTIQKLTSGSGATYTTPAGVRQLRIRMVGAGGGGGSGADTTNGAGNNGSAGGFTSFDNAGSNYKANGGAGGGLGNTFGSATAARGAAGGTGGNGTPSFRSQGVSSAPVGVGGNGGVGGSTVLGGPAVSSFSGAGNAAAANTGAGGGGGASGTGLGGAGGGGGEYVELIINSPAASYTYTIGAGGAGGTGTVNGGAGGSGVIIVDEEY